MIFVDIGRKTDAYEDDEITLSCKEIAEELLMIERESITKNEAFTD